MGAQNGALAAHTRERRPVSPSGASLCQLGGDSDNDSSVASDRQAFRSARAAALALLNGGSRLTRKAGSFLGQLAVDPTPLSGAQRDWLASLLERAELPPLAAGDDQ